MNKLSSLLMILITLTLLSACDLVKDETDIKTNPDSILENNDGMMVIGVIAYDVDENRLSPDTIDEAQLTDQIAKLIGGNLRVGSRLSLVEHSIETIDNETLESITLNYYVDTISEPVIGLMSIRETRDGIISYEPITPWQLSSRGGTSSIWVSSSVTENNITETTKFKVIFQDIDFLKQYKIIEFNQQQEKIAEQLLAVEEMTGQNVIELNSTTTNFMIIKTYINNEDKTIQVNDIYSIEEVEEGLSLVEHTAHTNGDYIRYQFNFTMGGE